MKKVFKEFFNHPAILIYCFIMMALFAGAVLVDAGKFASQLWILIIPVLLAPFFEWFAHKYLLHRLTDPLKQPASYKYMMKLHYRHHWEPNNLELVFAPISAAFFVFLLFAPAAYLIFNLQGLLIFEAAVVSYFLYYEWIHLAHHIASYRPVTKFGKHTRNAHLWHHYKNENFWWGVTNPIGDYVLSTFKDPKDVEASPSAKTLGDLQHK